MSHIPRKPESFIKQPTYPGGKKALDDFIKANLMYPEEAISNKVEGTVSVEYDVDVFGKVIATKVKHSLGYGCDEEAVRLVRLLKYPKKRYQGMRVVFHMTINIHFRLNEASKIPAQTSQQIVYNYVEKKAPQKNPATPATGFIIKLNGQENGHKN
jgi:TonB family protein